MCSNPVVPGCSGRYSRQEAAAKERFCKVGFAQLVPRCHAWPACAATLLYWQDHAALLPYLLPGWQYLRQRLEIKACIWLWSGMQPTWWQVSCSCGHRWSRCPTSEPASGSHKAAGTADIAVLSQCKCPSPAGMFKRWHPSKPAAQLLHQGANARCWVTDEPHPMSDISPARHGQARLRTCTKKAHFPGQGKLKACTLDQVSCCGLQWHWCEGWQWGRRRPRGQRCTSMRMAACTGGNGKVRASMAWGPTGAGRCTACMCSTLTVPHAHQQPQPCCRAESNEQSSGSTVHAVHAVKRLCVSGPSQSVLQVPQWSTL